ncbi:MAG: zinc ribbon domain-containing protein [Dehalococcoidia bacterium]|nr:zinc ribbon domain-containing protein [Dehalococcoidia bacterium]
MPVYDFKCRECGSTFEKLQRFSAKGAVTCPSCGGVQTQKLISMPAAIMWVDHDGGRQQAPSMVPTAPSGSGSGPA